MHADHRLSDVKTVAVLKPTGKIQFKNNLKNRHGTMFSTHHNLF